MPILKKKPFYVYSYSSNGNKRASTVIKLTICFLYLDRVSIPENSPVMDRGRPVGLFLFSLFIILGCVVCKCLNHFFPMVLEVLVCTCVIECPSLALRSHRPIDVYCHTHT